MGKLKSKRGKIVRIILIATLVLVLFFMLFGENAIRVAIEKGASQALKVGVTLDKLNLSLLKGEVELNDLQVDNPEGFKIPKLLTVGKGYVNLNTTSLLSDEIVIDKILLDEISLSFEQKGMSNNISAVLDSLEKEGEPVDEEKQEDKEKSQKPGKNLVINELTISNVEVQVMLISIGDKAEPTTIKLSPIVIKDIGKESDVDIVKLTEKILMSISKKLGEEAGNIIPGDIMGSLEGLKNIDTEKLGENLKEAGEDAKDAAKDALENLGGLFKKKQD